jgi:hypothetical protein
MRFVCACCILFSTTSLLAGDVQQTVKKSIEWLEKDMQTWRDERGCAACHHGPMYLWSISAAKRQGYEVNEAQLEEFTRWLLTDEEARIFPKLSKPLGTSAADRMTAAMMGHRNLSHPTIYLTHALNALPDKEPLKEIGRRKVVEHLASAQNEDGSFTGRNAWQPIFNTPQILTRFVATGLKGSDSPVLEKAEAFLASQVPDETQQGIVLRLLSQPHAKLVSRLKELQRPDGGWSQTDDSESDAFATGQALLAFHRAGVSGSAIQRSIDYLVRTQNDDGTWPMTSRPNPENGKPAELLNPITYAATAWATLGLTSCVPRRY